MRVLYAQADEPKPQAGSTLVCGGRHGGGFRLEPAFARNQRERIDGQTGFHPGDGRFLGGHPVPVHFRQNNATLAFG